MATTAGDIYVRSGNSGAFTEAKYVQGGWITVVSGSDMHSLDESRVADGQVIYVQELSQTYIVSKFEAFVTPGYSGFINSRSFEPDKTELGLISSLASSCLVQFSH